MNEMAAAAALLLGAATAGIYRKLKRAKSGRCYSVKYMSFSTESAMNDCVVVDCTHPDAPTFTHHRGNNNPAVDASDCSTGIVLNALATTNPSECVKSALAKRHVSSNHFDADAVLACWSLMNRETAGEYGNGALHAPDGTRAYEVKIEFKLLLHC